MTPKQHLPKKRGTAYSLIDQKRLKRVFNFILTSHSAGILLVPGSPEHCYQESKLRI